jgi:hypothetical protein
MLPTTQVDGRACCKCNNFGYCICACRTFIDDAIVDRICAVLDLEYFAHGQYRRIREMGFISMLDPTMEPVNLQINPMDLPLDNEKAYQSFKYVRDHIHGLSYYPRKGVTHSLVPLVIKTLYQSVKTSTKTVVAYKGGTLERDLLSSLNIPSFDLENLVDCPSYRLSDETLSDCGWHVHCPHGHLHCASAEVQFYQKWLFSRDAC